MPHPIAGKGYDWLGSVLTIAMPALIALEPYLRESVVAKFPPASAAILVAAFGGFLTVASRYERKKAAEDEAPAA